MDYDAEVEKNIERNEKFLEEFEEWLKDKNLSERTICNHVDNAEFYIDVYLTYYDIVKMEDGIVEVDEYFDDWFIRKCTWSSKGNIKSTAASLKKFYQCMSEKGYVDVGSYKLLCQILKDNMEGYLDSMDEYDKRLLSYMETDIDTDVMDMDLFF